MGNKGASAGQWVGATVLGLLFGIPFGMCNAAITAGASGSTGGAYFAWAATVILTIFMALGMIIQESEKRELRRRQLDDLRDRQG